MLIAKVLLERGFGVSRVEASWNFRLQYCLIIKEQNFILIKPLSDGKTTYIKLLLAITKLIVPSRNYHVIFF